MNKQEIVKEYQAFIKKFKLSPEEFVISAGGACVMFGIRDKTDDMDMEISQELFDQFLNSKKYNTHTFQGGFATPTLVIEYNDNIDLHTGQTGSTTIVDGVCCYSLERTLKQKLILNREKDQKDIQMLKQLIKAKGSTAMEELEEPKPEAAEGAAPSPMEFISTAAGNDFCIMGPLSQAYSEGLQELYAKTRTESGVALETEAMDVGMTQRAILSIKPVLSEQDQAGMGMLYGVQKGATTVSDLISVVDTLGELSPQAKMNSAVILDTMVDADRDHTQLLSAGMPHPTEVALEQYCKRKDVPVYASLQAFLDKQC